MRKHRSVVVDKLALVTELANQLRNARIDAAVVEYAEILMDPETVDPDEIRKRISQAKRSGFPPQPKWQQKLREGRHQARKE